MKSELSLSKALKTVSKIYDKNAKVLIL